MGNKRVPKTLCFDFDISVIKSGEWYHKTGIQTKPKTRYFKDENARKGVGDDSNMFRFFDFILFHKLPCILHRIYYDAKSNYK